MQKYKFDTEDVPEIEAGTAEPDSDEKAPAPGQKMQASTSQMFTVGSLFGQQQI
jgi:hypothetical protein